MEKGDKIFRRLGWILLALVPLFFIEWRPLENTIGGLRLCFWSGAVGAIGGFFLARFLIARGHFAPSRDTKVIDFYALIIFIALLLIPTVTSRLNRNSLFYVSRPYQAQYSVIKKIEESGRRDRKRYYVVLDIENRHERIQVWDETWRSLSEGSQVNVIFRRGLLGFPIVLQTEIVETS